VFLSKLPPELIQATIPRAVRVHPAESALDRLHSVSPRTSPTVAAGGSPAAPAELPRCGGVRRPGPGDGDQLRHAQLSATGTFTHLFG